MQKKIMDNYQDETTFEVTVAGDGVSTSGISSPQIVLDTDNTNTLSWGINECSSSFQSVSSCETLESYEPVKPESPKVIVVPFLTDHQVTGTMITNNGVHIPLIKECSIRIDPLKMTSTHSDGMNVEKIIELPFSTETISGYATRAPSYSDDDFSPFLGFDVESTNETLCELYRKAVRLIKENAAHVEKDQSRCSSEPIVIDRDSSESILTERILTERHFVERHSPKRNIKPETVKRPRQIQRKVVKPQLSPDQLAPQSQSRTTVNTEASLTPSPSKRNNAMKPAVPTAERLFSFPVQNEDVKNVKIICDSSGSDSDVIPVPVTPAVSTDNPTTKKKLERSADNKNNNRDREIKKLEKMRRRKELNWIREKIRDHWKEICAAARRKHRKKEAKRKKLESGGSLSTKSKRVSYSSDSDSDSTDSSSSSRTSCSSSSSDADSDDSDPDTYTSDTSYTSHTRTESDSTDTDSSDHRYRRRHNRYRHRHNRYRHRHNRYRRSPSETSETSETSSSDDDDDDDDNAPGKYVRLRKFQSMKRTHRRPSRSDENFTRSRKRKSSPEPHRSTELLHRKKRKASKNLDREEYEPRIMKNRPTFSQVEEQQRFNVPSTSSAARMNQFREFDDISDSGSTSAGRFNIK